MQGGVPSYLLFKDPIFTRETIDCDVIVTSNFFKTFIFSDARGLKSVKLPSDICFYRLFRAGSYFHARDNRLNVTSSSLQTFSKHLFWTGSDARGLRS